MKATLLLSFLVFFGMLEGVWAENLVLDYFDGSVAVRTKANSWQPLDVGAVLALDSVVRISENGVAEFSSGSTKLHLAKDGTFQLSAAFAQSQKRPGSNLMGLTNKQVGMILGTSTPNGVNVANMGARGAAKSGDEGMAWASDDAQASSVDSVEVIQAKIDQQDWDGALASTNKALASMPSDPQTLYFEKAVILSQMGRAAGALKALRDADLQQGEAHYFEAALLTGSQGLETEDYDLVLTKTQEALQLNPDKGIAQNLTLAQAMAWKGKGDPEKSKGLLNAVVRLEPQSGVGKEASRLLESN